MKRILALIVEKTSEQDKNWDYFRDRLMERMDDEAEIVMGELMSLVYEMTDDTMRVYDPERGFDLADFDLVVFKSIKQQYARTAACASYLQEKGVAYIDTRVQPGPWSKYSAQALHRASGLPVIPTVFSSNEGLIRQIESNSLPFSYPVIIKDVLGNKGKFNFIAHSAHEAIEIITRHLDIEFMLQKFIPNDGDYRFLVLGGEVKLAIHRKAQTGSHLNNTSMGAEAQAVRLNEFTNHALADVALSAQTEHLEVAGVDLIIDRETNRHYIIEVNGSPQLATGALPDEKMDSYAVFLKQLLQR